MSMKDTVLIVDDQAEIREILGNVVERECGYNVMAAETGEKALELLDEAEVAVVLLDIKLPGMSGLEVLERIRRKREDIVVVMMTGYVTAESAVEAMKQGALDYIMKPLDFNRIPPLVKRAVTIYHVYQEEKHEQENIYKLKQALRSLGKKIGDLANSKGTISKKSMEELFELVKDMQIKYFK